MVFEKLRTRFEDAMLIPSENEIGRAGLLLAIHSLRLTLQSATQYTAQGRTGCCRLCRKRFP